MTGSPATTGTAPRFRLFRSIFSNWTGNILSFLISLFLSPFVVRTLGDSAYGSWVLTNAIVAYLGLLELGVRGAVTRYVARLHATHDHASSSRLTSAALTFFMGAAAVSLFAALALLPLVGTAFNIPAELVATTRVVLLLNALSLALSLVTGVFGGIVVGRHRFDLSNVLEVGGELLRAGLVVAALLHGGGIVALAVAHLAVAVLRLIGSVYASRAVYPDLRLTPFTAPRAELRQLLAFGLVSTGLQVAGQLVLYSDSIVISAFLPVGLVTFFAIAANLVESARSFVSGVSQAMTPWASAIQATAPTHLAAVFTRGAKVASLVAYPMVITFVLRGETFISVWMGERYAEPSGEVLRILAIALFLTAGSAVSNAGIIGLNRHRGLLPVFLLEAGANLGLSILLIRPLGLVGVALGTTIPRLLSALLFGPWYLRRVVGIRMRVYVEQVWLRPMLAMLPFAMASAALDRWTRPDNLATYFAQVAVALPLAALGAWVMCLGPSERAELSRAVQGWLGRPLRTD